MIPLKVFNEIYPLLELLSDYYSTEGNNAFTLHILPCSHPCIITAVWVLLLFFCITTFFSALPLPFHISFVKVKNYYKEELVSFLQIPPDNLESASQDDTEVYKLHHYLINRKTCCALVATQGESLQVSIWKAESDFTEKIFPGEAFRFM